MPMNVIVVSDCYEISYKRGYSIESFKLRRVAIMSKLMQESERKWDDMKITVEKILRRLKL